MKLQTSRLFIRPVKIEDAESLHHYKGQKEVTEFQGVSFQSLKDILGLIKQNPKTLNIENTWFQLVIINKDNSDIVGDIGMHFIGPENMQLELGITMAPKYHRRGYAKEALKAIIDYSFTQLKKHRIIASIDPDNIASVALFESLNFRKEAHFKQSYYQNGVWKDDFIYAFLKSEFE